MFSTVAAPFNVPTINVGGFQFLHILTNTYYFPCFCFYCHPSGHEVVSICISLMTNNDEHLFMGLLATSRFSLETGLFKDLILFCISFYITSILHVSIVIFIGFGLYSMYLLKPSFYCFGFVSLSAFSFQLLLLLPGDQLSD